MKIKQNIAGFSIIEVLIGIFIFTLGLISIYLIMVSSLKLNDYNKNQIIASNLAREQIELLRNVRDSNYRTLYSWDSIPGTTPRDALQIDTYYTIENNFSTAESIILPLAYTGEGKNQLNDMEIFRLCLDSNRYIYCNGSTVEQTPFYRYIKIEDGGDSSAFKIISKVIWNKRGYHDLEINTILADWKRL